MKILVALSGGVDSTMTASLLKQAGHDLTAVFLLLPGGCSRRAEETAQQLDIPLIKIDLRDEFREKVIIPFIKGYEKGESPNPCVICNPKIKFNELLKRYPRHYLATGHYVRVKNNSLYRGLDAKKDQSYFLWGLKKKDISRLIFPMGGYKKEEIKKMAWDRGLSVPPESQGVCFLVGQKTVDFLEKEVESKPGWIIDKEGQKIKKHGGVHLFTLGQRKRVGLSGGPYFVLAKKKRDVVVTTNRQDLFIKEIKIKKINWLEQPVTRARVAVRYGHKGEMASIVGNRVLFDRPVLLPGPGQSAVFYSRNKLLGGGIIC